MHIRIDKRGFAYQEALYSWVAIIAAPDGIKLVPIRAADFDMAEEIANNLHDELGCNGYDVLWISGWDENFYEQIQNVERAFECDYPNPMEDLGYGPTELPKR